MSKLKVLGLINARGGSKGIPRKNIKMLGGQPLIAYSIQAGLAATSLARVVVSTDDPEIADVARRFGADVPFLRPAELAGDKSLQIEAIRHAIGWLEQAGDVYDAVAVLQPTCPLRQADDIDGAIALMEGSGADTVIAVERVEGYHPFTMYSAGDAGFLTPLLPANKAGVLRQEFPPVFWRNGAVYAIRRSVVMEQNSLYGERVAGFVMPRERSVNIDEPLDWVIAEALLQHRPPHVFVTPCDRSF